MLKKIAEILNLIEGNRRLKDGTYIKTQPGQDNNVSDMYVFMNYFGGNWGKLLNWARVNKKVWNVY